ncbi:MAG: hypothetical protein OXJ55_16560 [Caldilineaceae bacterium]|nr:hypothetical protein [Caldilineaceae bacterium]
MILNPAIFFSIQGPQPIAVDRPLVTALAHRTLILHAAQGSKPEALCQQALADAKPVYTLPSPHNVHLIALGAQPLPPDDPSALLTA